MISIFFTGAARVKQLWYLYLYACTCVYFESHLCMHVHVCILSKIWPWYYRGIIQCFSCEYVFQIIEMLSHISVCILSFICFQRNDIAMAISKYDQFDFLIDIVPRDELKPPKRPVSVSIFSDFASSAIETPVWFEYDTITQWVTSVLLMMKMGK